ncbi:MAG: hypothetical protein KF810_16805 [Rhizobiaceae bacterium]|nr:hypothetical protein [Rhizobiaceae bacterium]
MRIIYPNGDGVSVIYPDPKFLVAGFTVEDAARKDTPAGIPYRIVNDDDIPVKDELRNLWTADFSDPDGYGIGPDAWRAEKGL